MIQTLSKSWTRLAVAMVITLALCLYAGGMPVYAQDGTAAADTAVESADDSAGSDNAADSADSIGELDVVVDDQTGEVVDTSLEDIEVNVPDKAPGAFGLFFRGLRERVSVALTTDPVKKAEKQVQFAEERMQIAQKIVESSNNEKAQERAQKVIERAHELVQKVEERKDEWMQKNEEKVQALVKNIANHEVRREKVLDRIEERLPEGSAAVFQNRRVELQAESVRLLNAINNENVPEKIREHLSNVKDKIEGHAAILEEFKQKKDALFKDAREGSEVAQEKLKELLTERKENLADLRERDKEVHREIIEKHDELRKAAKEGDLEAKKKIEEFEKNGPRPEEFIDNSSAELRSRMRRLDTRIEEKRDERAELRAKGIDPLIPPSASVGIIDPTFKTNDDAERRGIIDPTFKPAVHKAIDSEEAKEEMKKIKPSYKPDDSVEAIIDPIYKKEDKAAIIDPIYKEEGRAAIIDPIYKEESKTSIIDPVYKKEDKAAIIDPIYKEESKTSIIDPIYDNSGRAEKTIEVRKRDVESGQR